MDTNINTQKKDYLLPASVIIAGVLIAAAVIYTNSLQPSSANQQANVQKTISGNPLNITKDDVVLGNANAPVIIVLYSDPSCPYCAANEGANQKVIDYLKQGSPGWTPAVPGIIDNYVKTGKAKLVFRYFPGHGTGEEAMKTMLCANEQGKFWDLKSLIFANQSIIEDQTKVRELAGTLGVDLNKLDACLASKKYDQKLKDDTSSGKTAGVDGTPAFFVNDQKIEAGAQPFSVLKSAIDKILTSK